MLRPPRAVALPAVVLLCLTAIFLACRIPGFSNRDGRPRSSKTGRTYYTDERIATGKQNASRYPWGREVRRRIFETGDSVRYYIGPQYTPADLYAAQTDEFLWLLQPTTKIPRVIDKPESVARCPLHGDKVRAIDSRCPWHIDPIGHPYQIQCPLGGEWYPSNRIDHGDLSTGPFADDGNGFLYNGIRYFPVREYCHMVYGSVVVPTLRSLSQAYLLSGDRRYAHKGSVLLARLASEYPNYGWDGLDSSLENRTDRTYLGPWNNQDPQNSWKRGGMITDCIWECSSLEAIALAYDAFYDYLGHDPDLIRFLQKKGMTPKNGRELRRYVEDYILRAGARALCSKMIWGNPGSHQATALAVALVLDDYSDRHPNTKDLVDFAYLGPAASSHLLTNALTRDGGGLESPNYNSILSGLVRVARDMEIIRRDHPALYPVATYPDIFDQTKARAFFDYNIDILVNDCVLPAVGDCGTLEKPRRNSEPKFSMLGEENVFAAARYGDPRFAGAAVPQPGQLPVGELWEPFPEEQLKALLARPESGINRQSRVMDDYGLAILESGQWPDKRTAYLNYSALFNHRQADNLAIGYLARGFDLLPDLGYPASWEYRLQWEGNSLAHNTVTVDETQPAYWNKGGTGLLFATLQGVHVISAGYDPYPGELRKGAPGVDLFQRTLVMIDVDGEQSYTIDLFNVNGGEQHDQSWHGMMVPSRTPPLRWQAQTGGTLAGPAVPEFGSYTDRWGRPHEKGDFPSFLTSIRHAQLTQSAEWTWLSGLPEGDGFCLTVVPLDGPLEAIMGRGRSPVWTDKQLDFLLLRRRVTGGAATRFLSVLEGFQGTRVVKRIQLRQRQPVVLEVEREGGTDEITLNFPSWSSGGCTTRSVGLRVRSRSGGQWTRDVRIGSWTPSADSGFASSVIVALDRTRQALAVPYQPGDENTYAVGRTVRVRNPLHSGLYKIRAVRREGESLWITLQQSSLFACGPVKEAGAGALVLNTVLLRGTSTVSGAKVTLRQDDFSGTWLSTDGRDLQVAGAAPQGVIFLRDPVPGAALENQYKTRPASIWEYGVGDSVTAPRFWAAEEPRSGR